MAKAALRRTFGPACSLSTRMNAAPDPRPHSVRRSVSAAFGLLLLGLGVSWLWWAGEIAVALRDPALAGPAPAQQSWRWHRALTPAFAAWAQQRRGDPAVARLPLQDIAGTEWPLFGAVFYLRATENLDRAWAEAPHGPRPAEYARAAIDAAADLLADPAQSGWVQRHWGADDYLRRENVFFRMLLIDALATQWRLTGRTPHATLLRTQVESFAAELAQSSTGLLADYPGQTFPADVAAAWHAIRRADPVLGTDHAGQMTAGLRAFRGALAPELGLPPYAWFGEGDPEPTEVRGCANAWLLHHAPFLWPAQARDWQQRHAGLFWQRGRWFAGYREFARGSGDEWYADVDSGPVIAGLGTSATAFGLGAARSVAADAQAEAIALQMVALSWPLPNGRLLLPRLLSDASDAPLLGEAAIVYNLSQPAAPGFTAEPVKERRVPWIVWLMLVVLLGMGGAALLLGGRRVRRALARSPSGG